MGYWFYDTFIDALTLKEQQDIEDSVKKRLAVGLAPMSITPAQPKQQTAEAPKRGGGYNSNLARIMRRDRLQIARDYEDREWEKFSGEKWIYFLYNPNSHLLKIGYSSKLRQRIKTLRLKYPDSCLWATLPGDTETERRIHKIMKGFNCLFRENDGAERREWFLIERPVLFFIKYFANYGNEFLQYYNAAYYAPLSWS